ncbi:MAG: hypothetical protein AAGB51_01310 [Planctomycetota bacterium]
MADRTKTAIAGLCLLFSAGAGGCAHIWRDAETRVTYQTPQSQVMDGPALAAADAAFYSLGAGDMLGRLVYLNDTVLAQRQGVELWAIVEAEGSFAD